MFLVQAFECVLLGVVKEPDCNLQHALTFPVFTCKQLQDLVCNELTRVRHNCHT